MYCIQQYEFTRNFLFVKRKALITCQCMPKTLIPQLIIEFWIRSKPTHKVLSLTNCAQKQWTNAIQENLFLSVNKGGYPKIGMNSSHLRLPAVIWLVIIVALIWLVWHTYMYISQSQINWSKSNNYLSFSTHQTTESGMNGSWEFMVQV